MTGGRDAEGPSPASKEAGGKSGPSKMAGKSANRMQGDKAQSMVSVGEEVDATRGIHSAEIMEDLGHDDDDANVGLPPLGGEEDECHLRMLREAVRVISYMCAEEECLRDMRHAGASAALVPYLRCMQALP